MGAIGKSVGKILLLVGFIPVGSYFLLLGWLFYASPLTYMEMDFNKDGTVSLSELDYATSYGTKEVEQKGEKCIEYFAYKDGLPLKVVCPKS